TLRTTLHTLVLLNGSRFDRGHLVGSHSGELLGSTIIVRVQFERTLVRTSGFVFLVGLQIAVADAFEAENSCQLPLLGRRGECRRAFVSCFSVTEPVHSQVSTTQKIERLKRTRCYFSRRLQIGFGFLESFVNDQVTPHQQQRRQVI